MVSTFIKMNFDEIVAAVQAKIECHNSAQMETPNTFGDDRPTIARFLALRGRGRREKFNPYRGKGREGGQGRGFGKSHDDSRVCHHCGKSGHFIKFCLNRIQDECRGIFKNSHSRRGRGTAHTSRYPLNAYHQGDHRQNFSDDHNGRAVSSTGPIDNANLSAYQPQDPLSYNPPTFNNDQSYHGPHARMAKIKFRSKVARMDEKKSNDAYIDSGATHHFFHSRGSFISYETIPDETVRAAYGETRIVGKGTVCVPIADGYIQESYHAPAFSSNILASDILSEDFEVLKSSSISLFKGCFLFEK